MEIWDKSTKARTKPGVTRDELAQWEQKHGVQLPPLLRTVLTSQNGGPVRYSDVVLFPLAKIIGPDQEFWDNALYPKSRFAKRQLVFQFAEGTDTDALFLLNFNANGPAGEPTVHRYYGDPGDINPESNNLAAFFTTLLDVTEKPAIDWTETTQLDTILFQEKLTAPFAKKGRHEESILGRKGGQLYLYRHSIREEEEYYLKVQVHEPLSKDDFGCTIDTIPSSPPVFALRLVSKNEGKSISTESHRMPDGRWKNQELGALDDIESLNLESLRALRRQLLGAKAAARLEANEDDQNELMSLATQFQNLPSDQQKNLKGGIVSQFMNLLSGGSGSPVDIMRKAMGSTEQKPKKKK